MNVGKHTPGPWEIQQFVPYPHSDKITYIVASDVFDIVSPHLLIRRPEDALLIAAAPDLLDLLKTVVNEGWLSGNNLEMACREAIARAEQ